MREAIKLQIIHDTMAIYKEKKKGEKEWDGGNGEEKNKVGEEK